jgi:hypothetical protein
MQFSLMGFSEDTGFRVFAFEGVAAGRTRMKFTVKTDLALIRRYGIRMQELPLLCREILERQGEGDEKCALIFSEDDMRLHVLSRAEAYNSAMQKKKSAA